MDAAVALRTKWEAVRPHFNERQRRLWACAEARGIGRGGITLVASATGLSRQTLHSGMRDLDAPPSTDGRMRRPGAGRKPLHRTDPELAAALDALLDPDVRGDPESPLRWTCKSTGQLALALTRGGHPVSASTVGTMLREQGYSLQANVKTKEGSQHPDRDAQFHYLNEQARQFRDTGQPVISVDCKKKELIGEFKNGGREWRPKRDPVRVNIHDFITEQGKAIPYGVYDIERNVGWVNVGQDHETAAFAVESIRRWWRGDGILAYPDADQLLISADCGGANGHRARQWKTELWSFARESGLAITVCHLPPGTSKWNKIEHRLFSHISMNWRGRPLTSHEVVVQLIATTTTKAGLKVHAMRDLGIYPTKVEVSTAEMKGIRLLPHAFHGEWNYTLDPRGG